MIRKEFLSQISNHPDQTVSPPLPEKYSNAKAFLIEKAGIKGAVGDLLCLINVEGERDLKVAFFEDANEPCAPFQIWDREDGSIGFCRVRKFKHPSLRVIQIFGEIEIDDQYFNAIKSEFKSKTIVIMQDSDYGSSQFDPIDKSTAIDWEVHWLKKIEDGKEFRDDSVLTLFSDWVDKKR